MTDMIRTGGAGVSGLWVEAALLRAGGAAVSTLWSHVPDNLETGLQTACLDLVLRQRQISPQDYTTPEEDLILTLRRYFPPGVESEQANLVYGPVKRTLAGGGNEALKLSDGSLQDALQHSLVFVTVSALVLQNLSSTKVLTVGVGTAPLVVLGAADQTVILEPLGMLALDNPLTGWTVVLDTSDGIRIANDAGDPADYLIWILGAGGYAA
jgi:hypothetical protein